MTRPVVGFRAPRAGSPPAARLARRPAWKRRLTQEPGHLGLWASQNGSLYLFDGTCFRCLAVHSPAFRGWVGKVAVKDVRRDGAHGTGMQAFRCRVSGELSEWMPITLVFEPFVITKYFPDSARSSELVYGYVERYYRLRDRGRGIHG